MSESTLYQVADWDRHFESAKTREYNNKSHATHPAKFGIGYMHLVSARDGAALYGAFHALVCVLSRHPKPRNGWVTDDGSEDGRPLTSQDLELQTRIPARHYERMLGICASASVGWIVAYDVTDTTRIPRGYHADTIGPLHRDKDKDKDIDKDIDRSFEKVWKRYPDKSGSKAKARDAYTKAVRNGTAPEDVEAGLTKYLAYVAARRANGFPDLSYANGQTWFNQRRWESEYEIKEDTTNAMPIFE